MEPLRAPEGLNTWWIAPEASAPSHHAQRSDTLRHKTPASANPETGYPPRYSSEVMLKNSTYELAFLTKQSCLRLAKRFKRFSPLLVAPAALVLGQGQAKAVLTYNIFESGSDVVVQASGSLTLPTSPPLASVACVGSNGGIRPAVALICTGPAAVLNAYGVTGPASFNGGAPYSGSATSSLSTILIGNANVSLAIFGINSPIFGISPAYSSGTTFVSSSVLTGKALSGLGFTISSGLLGTWTLNGTNDTFYACLGAASCAPAAPVPGPLPLLGAGAAFGWSRRLRRRIASPGMTPTEA